MREDPPRDDVHRRDRYRHFRALHESSAVLVRESEILRRDSALLLAASRALRDAVRQTGQEAAPPSPPGSALSERR